MNQPPEAYRILPPEDRLTKLTATKEVVVSDAMERETVRRLRARLLEMIADHERLRRTHVPPATLLP